MKKNEEDFGYTFNAEGYMITYKGQNIGGASIMGKSKSRGRARTLQIFENKESAIRDIEHIVNNRMSLHIRQAIERIDGI